MKIICVNNTLRPPEIPMEFWPKLHKEYTLIDAICVKPQNTIMLIIKEINLVEQNFVSSNGLRFQGFAIERFGSYDHNFVKKVNEMIKSKINLDGVLDQFNIRVDRTEEELKLLIEEAVKDQNFEMAAVYQKSLNKLK